MQTVKPIIIAIDGFSSSGKSTMARALAARIGYRYIDSGAMYRAVTLWAMRHGLIDDEHNVDVKALEAALHQIHIDFKVVDGGQHTMLNGEDVEDEIRKMPVSDNVSPIAAIPAVRHALTALQQSFGHQRGIVMDGRDIGTTVFPDAELKIYLNASAQTRAERRYKELMAKGVDASFDDILANIRQRDHIDMTRDESPLRRADDAIDLDNSNMTLEEQDRWLLDRFNSVTESNL